MKRVLLLGDSIRMGYDDYVREYLDGRCEVIFDANDNGRFSAYTLWQANQMFKWYGRFDAVHWNNGYWDMNIEAPMAGPIHPVDEYLHFLRRILGEIRQNGAKPIFATTTPILFRGSGDDAPENRRTNYRNAWVVQYNEAARSLMAAEGVTVNDLYSLCLQDEHYYKCEDCLHLTEEGYRRCAAQTGDTILRELGML